MNKCPECGNTALTPIQKLSLGPIISKNCNNCKSKVGVTFFHYFMAFLPIPISFYFAATQTSPALKLILWLIGGAITSYIYIKLVPLVNK